MNLKEMFPKSLEFKLASTNNTYKIRHSTIRDELWLEQEIGRDKLFQIEGSTARILKIAYHLLVDKSDFMSVEHVEIDEEGNEQKIRIGGLELFKMCIFDKEEYETIYICTLNALGYKIDKEMLERAMNEVEVEEVKKKQKNNQKKSN